MSENKGEVNSLPKNRTVESMDKPGMHPDEGGLIKPLSFEDIAFMQNQNKSRSSAEIKSPVDLKIQIEKYADIDEFPLTNIDEVADLLFKLDKNIHASSLQPERAVIREGDDKKIHIEALLKDKDVEDLSYQYITKGKHGDNQRFIAIQPYTALYKHECRDITEQDRIVGNGPDLSVDEEKNKTRVRTLLAVYVDGQWMKPIDKADAKKEEFNAEVEMYLRPLE